MNDHAEQVILVDEADRALSHGGKLQIHEEGLLHRAFSIFVFNDAGECLIQKRARRSAPGRQLQGLRQYRTREGGIPQGRVPG